MTGAALGRASVYFVTISGGLGLSVAAAFLCVCISLNRYIMSIRWSDGFQGWPFHVFIRPPIFLCLLCKRRREREGKRGRGREIETDRLHRLPTCNRWHSRLPLLPHPWPSQPDAFEYSEGEHFVVLELVGLSATGRHACFFPFSFPFFLSFLLRCYTIRSSRGKAAKWKTTWTWKFVESETRAFIISRTGIFFPRIYHVSLALVATKRIDWIDAFEGISIYPWNMGRSMRNTVKIK